MSFFADKQTLEDLNILGRHKNNSVARLFDAAVTAGGKKLMDKMFLQPLTNADEINKRSSIFQYFAKQQSTFPFTAEKFAVMENYLASGGGNLISTAISIVSKRFLQIAAQDKDYELLNTEVCHTIELLNQFYDFLHQLLTAASPYSDELHRAKTLITDKRLNWLLKERGMMQLPLGKLIKYDHLLRTSLYQQMEQLMEIIFRLDVYIAVAAIANHKGLSFAVASNREANVLTVNGLYHLTVSNAIGNALQLHQDMNVIFLTGANMAGKSTLMRSFGIAVYLAHMGFPVPASNMEFSVKDGIYTSINVPDNLSSGYSHFYAEVLRVKTIAQQVADDKDLVVIFDELFKGTNVKDAYDATYAITEAFSENRNCFFIISTHITEVGESLRKQCQNFRFVYLPTVMDGNVPHYTYLLQDGITADRHGMMIIENEGILDIIKG